MDISDIAKQNPLLPAASLEALSEIISRPDPSIIGIILTGSAARGMATQHSDVDVMVIRDEPATAEPREDRKILEVDELPRTLQKIENVPAPASNNAWERWSYAWSIILRDDAGGRVTEAVRRQATFTDEEVRKLLVEESRLDWFINDSFRALKSHRDGRPRAARMDSAGAVPPMIELIFALAGRVAPYNKYLEWELTNHPLPSEEWRDGRLLSYVEGMLDGDVASVRAAFQAVERECRAYDKKKGRQELGDIIDEWGSDLDIFRRVD